MSLTWKNLLFSSMKTFYLLLMDSLTPIFLVMEPMVLSITPFSATRLIFLHFTYLDTFPLNVAYQLAYHFETLTFQEVAIKRMTATKTREFTAEMKVLCKVHHLNLVMNTEFHCSTLSFLFFRA